MQEWYREFHRDARQLDNLANAMQEWAEEDCSNDPELMRLMNVLVVATSNVLCHAAAEMNREHN
jgi:DNA-binding SARP family transcriptional activator